MKNRDGKVKKDEYICFKWQKEVRVSSGKKVSLVIYFTTSSLHFSKLTKQYILNYQ